MTVKMTGKEFKAFCSDPAVWGPGDDASCDETLITVNGMRLQDWDPSKISDTDKITVESGYMECQPAGVPDEFAKAARWWLKRQTTTTLVIECHKDKLEAVTTAIKAAGGKIL